MPLPLDRAEIKAEARSLMRCGSVRPVRMTALFLAITFFLSLISDTVTYLMDGGAGMIALPLVFVSILISLVSLVLNAGYTCYCLGIHRREQMPYTSLFDAFSFADKVILLAIVQGIFIFLWSLLFIVPGIIAAYRYSFAMLNLCRNPELGAMEALNLSKQQTAGYKWQLFVLQLSFIGWYLLAAAVMWVYWAAVYFLLPDSYPGIMLGSLLFFALSIAAEIYLKPYLQLSVCGFYLRATAEPPQEPNDWYDPAF